MKSTLRKLFVVIEVNLLLWIAVFGSATYHASKPALSWWREDVMISGRLVVLGMLFAAVAQHWAYYAMKRELEAAGPAGV